MVEVPDNLRAKCAPVSGTVEFLGKFRGVFARMGVAGARNLLSPRQRFRARVWRVR